MLGLVTIGQSPREDVVASMFSSPVQADVVEAGALDELDRQQIAALSPGPDEPPLVTRLRDGSEVVIGKKQVLPLMERAVGRLEADGCTTICVLCTGEFPRLGQSALVIYPDRLLLHVVEALVPEGVLGVLMPHVGQRRGMLAKWTTPARSAVTGVASPYSGSDAIASEVRRLVEAGAEAIVLDCMGFDRRMLADARSATSKPVILANGLVGGVLREVVGVSAGFLDGVQRA
ncbi:MAG TPA: AroM family protein [Thermomicrobiales bacterium]|nr:AroM family protein [Thermomicrobiales bacterium]